MLKFSAIENYAEVEAFFKSKIISKINFNAGIVDIKKIEKKLFIIDLDGGYIELKTNKYLEI